MTEKKKRGRPPKIRKIDPVTPEVAAEIYNAEHPEQHTSVYEVKLPSNWDTMGKIDRLKWLKNNRL